LGSVKLWEKTSEQKYNLNSYPIMEKVFESLKNMLPGLWHGSGFAQYPTIQDTGYTEELRFISDNDKQAILYMQKSWYKNDTENNSKTVFWDTGFIIYKEETIQLISAQSGGRAEIYHLAINTENAFTFNCVQITNDNKTITSQRIFTIKNNRLDYQLNMSTHQNTNFQNHLSASLTTAGNV
jgi:UTP:GlnB (protein PII) uridylyltransferase